MSEWDLVEIAAFTALAIGVWHEWKNIPAIGKTLNEFKGRLDHIHDSRIEMSREIEYLRARVDLLEKQNQASG